ncbi:MAG: cobalamin biosynthesis protein, partial [Burkholderia gladioli]
MAPAWDGRHAKSASRHEPSSTPLFARSFTIRPPSMTCIAPDRTAAPRIVVGVGCRAGKSPEAIEAAIAAALARRAGLALADIARVATLDAKAGEPG